MQDCRGTKQTVKDYRDTKHEPTKAKRNAEYTAKLQRGIKALNAGHGVEHEIIEDYDE